MYFDDALYQDHADEIDDDLLDDEVEASSETQETEQLDDEERCPFCGDSWICSDYSEAVYCLDILRGSGDQFIVFRPCCEELRDAVPVTEDYDEEKGWTASYPSWREVFGRTLEEMVAELFGWEVRRVLGDGTIDCGLRVEVPGELKGRTDAPSGVTVESPEGWRDEVFAEVAEHHRHHEAPQGWRYGAAVYNGPTRVGVAVAARPVSRRYAEQNPAAIEVTRVATWGHPDLRRNASSKLYGACGAKARELHAAGTLLVLTALLRARAPAYVVAAWLSRVPKLVTYTLESENGASLKASGFRAVHQTRGESWDRAARPRTDKAPTTRKTRWERPL